MSRRALKGQRGEGLMEVLESHQTVATPYFRDVRTDNALSRRIFHYLSRKEYRAHLRDCKT